jgi:hypothetical protein
MDDDLERLARGYRAFAEIEAAEVSPLYAGFALAVAADERILRFLAALPAGKRQPNLLFAAVQYLHGTAPDADEFRRLVLDDAERVRATMLARSTQTNEAARCAALLPLLAAISGPLALIEVGASAGLCLYPDRYGYDYDGTRIGPDAPVTIRCTTTGGGPVPAAVPDIVARIGLDLNPLDITDDDVRAWLRALVWPGPQAAARLARLDAAADVARREPARILAGDLLDRLPEALDLVPAGATPVVFHTAVLMYVPRARRAEFVDRIGSLPVRWIAQEGPDVLPELTARLPEEHRGGGGFVLALDGRPVARTAPHGGRIDWLPDATTALASTTRR